MVRRFGLRGKFVVALLFATALPFLIGLVLIEKSFFRFVMAERGKLHEMEAAALAGKIQRTASHQSSRFLTWEQANPVISRFLAENASAAPVPPQQLQELDRRWPELTREDPQLRKVTENPASANLRNYRNLHPEIAEILVTDATGGLAAATGMSSDFLQADEEWWQMGRKAAEGAYWMSAIHLDQSAKVYSAEVVIPLHRDGAFLGMVKITEDLSTLFTRLPHESEHKGERWQIILPDGRILADSDAAEPPLSRKAEPDLLTTLREKHHGWTLAGSATGEGRMVGFVGLGGGKSNATAYVIFSSLKREITAPLRRLLGQLTAAGLILLLIGLGLGFLMIRRNVLQPLAVLGNAARSISSTAHLSPTAGPADDAEREQAEKNLKHILAIHTGDEVQDLAEDLAVMTRRVLRYHRELENEVAAKTAVIREDLDLAREFQQALLPAVYPDVPSTTDANPLRLAFAHFYQPASTLGGDFFDIIELDDNRAGVLIADVMGHGARSALVTAILRALIRNISATTCDPGEFMSELNRHLHEVIERSNQTLFVTAFLLVLDTSKGEATWAVAGHPAPLRMRRGSVKEPAPLWTESPRQPALGLLPEYQYHTSQSQLIAGDVFLLFTDGVHEAENPSGEAFGMDRLAAAFDESLDGPLAAMPAKVVCEVAAFQRRSQSDDDICVVAVEALGRRQPPGE